MGNVPSTPSALPPVPLVDMPSPPRSQLAIVTGANSGIGKETAGGLMEHGCHVILACRSMPRCQEAKQELERRHYAGSCECSQLDVGDLCSVREFVERTEKQLTKETAKYGGGRIKYLVNNAAVMGGAAAKSAGDLSDRAAGSAADVATGQEAESLDSQKEGPPVLHGRRHRHKPYMSPDWQDLDADPHIKPNYLGPYLLTRLLTPRLGPGSRVVTVASEAHLRAPRLTVADRGLDPAGGPTYWYSQYARSKLCTVMFTKRLATEYERRQNKVQVYSVSPGRVATNIFSGVPWPLDRLLKPLSAAAFKTPQQGAADVLYACLAEELEGKSVLYLHDMRESPVNPQVHDDALVDRLWDVTERMVGLGDGKGKV